MPSLPSSPYPVHSLVPWAQGVWPIVWRAPHPVLHWVYTIYAKPPNEPLHIHWNVSQADIVRAMLAHAAFSPESAETHRKRIAAKLNAHSKAELVRLVLVNGWG